MLDVPTGPPGHPPLSTPGAYLWWVARRGWVMLCLAVLVGTVEALCAAAIPFLLGRTLDAGLATGLSRDLLLGAGLLLGVGVLQALASALAHVAEVGGWVHGTFTTSRLVGHHVTRTGPAIGDELATGEVVSTVASDAFHVGNVLEVLPKFVGGLVAYAAVALVLLRDSVALGLAVLLGLPLVSLLLTLVIRPLHARQAAQREAAGRLATLGADTVSGLRVLRGIGGEDVFADRYRAQSQHVRRAGVKVATTQSVLEALQVLLPGALVAAVVWFGAHLALRGEITPGQLVAFYGYTAFLAQPLRAATHFIQFLTRARVAAHKVTNVLAVTPAAGTLAESEQADTRPAAPAPPPAELADEASGVVLHPGVLTALVAAQPEDAAALARRLGRLDDAHATGVRLGGADVLDLPVAEVRRRVVVSDATPELFTGALRTELDVRGDAVDDDARLLAALEVADAHDVLTSVPGGLDGQVTEKGRSLSGGQRQRVALARALLTEAPALVLIEPTSAVDAHTEARIAARLARYRRGRTTVVVTASPLVLEHADEVVLLDAGRERVRGRHHELLARAAAGDRDAAAYRAVVHRGMGEVAPAGTTDAGTEVR